MDYDPDNPFNMMEDLPPERGPISPFSKILGGIVLAAMLIWLVLMNLAPHGAF